MLLVIARMWAINSVKEITKLHIVGNFNISERQERPSHDKQWIRSLTSGLHFYNINFRISQSVILYK